MAFLYDYQEEAVRKMKNGCILAGGVGTGKSRTSLAYYFTQNGGTLEPLKPMKADAKDLYIITTARKRDTLEWEGELLPFGLDKDPEKSLNKVQIVIDSWNNISKYKNVEDAFFIFDEQRVVGKGAWVKSFIRIAKNEKYNKAVKIEDQELFEYGMRTDIGNAFVYGNLEAVDTVTYPEIGGKYMYVRKVEEHYTRHE